MSLKLLSLTSRHLFQIILFGSIFNSEFWNISFSITADIKLFALLIACKSPVKCKLILSNGNKIALFEPDPVPFNPKTGPIEGSLKQPIAFIPILFKPSTKPIDVVVLPSPIGVGFIAVTITTFASFLLGIIFLIFIISLV